MADSKSGVFPRLQDLCLLYLVNNVQDYPSDSLKLIPPTLRRRLIPLLPAASLHELENTSTSLVWSDIDSIDKLWFNLYTSFYQDQYTSLIGPKISQYGKKSLLNKAMHQALQQTEVRPLWATNCDNHIGGVLDAIVCVPKSNDWIFSDPYLRILDAYNLYVVCKKCKCVCPGRLLPSPDLQPFTNAKHQKIVICELLVNVFDWFPSSISHYYQSKSIINEGLNNGAIGRFLCGTKELKLHCYQQVAISEFNNDRSKMRSYITNSEVLKLILLSFPYALRLTSLSLNSKVAPYNFNSLMISELLEIAPYFAPISPPKEEHSLPKDFTPYALLESLTIMGLSTDSEECLHLLISIINYQVCLKEIDITCCIHNQSDFSDLFESLTCTFKRSEKAFKRLALKGVVDFCRFVLSPKCFASSLSEIFTIPPLTEDEQTVELKFATIIDLTSNGSQPSSPLRHKASPPPQFIECPGKVLYLRDVVLNKNAIEYLTLKMPHYHIEKIKICTTISKYDNLSDWRELTNLTANQISLKFSSEMGASTIPDCPLIGGLLSNWLLFQHVSKLELNGVTFLLSPSHLLSLTEVFSRSPITHLSLIHCHLGEVSRTSNIIGTPLSISLNVQDGLIKRRNVIQFSGELGILLTSIVEFLHKTDNQFEFILEDRSIDFRHLLLVHSIWESSCGGGKKKKVKKDEDQSTSDLRFKLLHVTQPLNIPKSLREEFKTKMNQMSIKFCTQMFKTS